MISNSTLILESGLSASRKIVLSALVTLLSGKRCRVLSIDTIGRAAGTPVRTVARVLNELQALELVYREAGKADGRRNGVIRAPSSFRIDLAQLREVAIATRELIRERLDEAYARMSVRRAELQRQRSATVARSNESSTSSSYFYAKIALTKEGSIEFWAVAQAMVDAGLGTSIDDFEGMGRK